MRTPTLAARLLPLALLGLAACGKPLLYAEVEIPSAKVTLASQTFPSTASPAPADLCPAEVVVAPGNTCIQRTFGFDLGGDFRDLIKDSMDIELRLTRLGITLAATDPLGDFGSVEQVLVGVSDPGGVLPGVDIATYRKSAANPTPSTIVVGGQSNVDLGTYLIGSQLQIYARLEFNRVIDGFTADVLADFYAKVLVDYGKAGGIY